MDLLFFLGYFFTFLACSLFAYSKPRLFVMPGLSRAFFGASLTPFILACYPFFIAYLFPDSPKLMFMLLPLVVALVYVFYKRLVFIRLVKKVQIIVGAEIQKIFIEHDVEAILYALIFLAGAIVLAVMFWQIWNNAHQMLNDHDGTAYFYEAIPFAQYRTLSAIPGFIYTAGHVVINNPHSYFFQGLLSYGLMFSNGGVIGFPNDFIARLLSESTVFSLLLALISMAAFYRKKCIASFSIIILGILPFVGTMTATCNRDAFRLAPLVLLILWASSILKKRKINLSNSIIAGVLVFFAIQAHTLNIVACLLVGFSFLLLSYRLFSRKQIALFLAVVFIFFILSCFGYIDNFRKYGSVYGYGMTFIAIKGSLLDTYYNHSVFLKYTKMNIISSLFHLFKEYGLYIPLISFLSAIVFVIMAYYFKIKKHIILLPICFLLLILIPILDSSGATGISLKSAMLMNYRYSLMAFVLSGLVIALLIFWAYGFLLSGAKTPIKLLLLFVILFVSYWSMVISVHNVIFTWKQSYNVPIFMKKMVFSLSPYIESLSSKQNWYTDNLRMAYYFKKHPIFAYSYDFNKLLYANNKQRVWNLLRKWNIRLLVIYNFDKFHNIGDSLALNKVLNHSVNIKRTKSYWWSIYRVKNFPIT